LAAGGRLRILPEATIGGDMILAGGDVILEGSLARSLRAVAGKILLNGAIAGPASVRTETMTIGASASLEDALSYFAPQEAAVDPAAKLKGPVSFHLISGMDQAWLRWLLRRAGIAFFILRFAMTLAAGLLLFFLLQRVSQELIAFTLEHFWRELLLGFILFFVIPPVIFLIAITVVGVPVAFLGGLFHLGVGILSVIYSGIAIGALVLQRVRADSAPVVSWSAVLIGIPTAFLVSLVPYFGLLLNAAFFLAVFGTIYQRFWTLLRGARASLPE
ncbi:MAG TPA: hypothetical protein VNN17_03415, partial [Terriglobia bacterium]|nr:hypothetical protein [Terriglobia bacterium]